MKRLQVIEGQPIDCTPQHRDALLRSLQRLKLQLQSKTPLYAEQRGRISILNLVGSIQVTPGLTVEVVPKTQPGADWVGATLDLLGASRAEISGHRRGSATGRTPNLDEALAEIYANRLETAVRLNGPMEILQRRDLIARTLRGRLNTTQWARTSLFTPHKFPMSVQELSTDNDFARAMAYCAQTLASRSHDPRTARRLRALLPELRPGATAQPTIINPAIAKRPLPAQWSGYSDPWAIVQSLLSRAALLGRTGSLDAFDVVLESWPLLENLLQRTLHDFVRRPGAQRLDLTIGPRGTQRTLLSPVESAPRETRRVHNQNTVTPRSRRVNPDGLLYRAGKPFAVFEAKYRTLSEGKPPRENIFQSLTTAAAFGAKHAFLIYPGDFPMQNYQVHGHHGAPQSLTVLGLDLFNYSRNDESRASQIAAALTCAPVVGHLP